MQCGAAVPWRSRAVPGRAVRDLLRTRGASQCWLRPAGAPCSGISNLRSPSRGSSSSATPAEKRGRTSARNTRQSNFCPKTPA